MICLDSSFLIDYLKGRTQAKEALHTHQQEGLCITELAIFETAAGYFYHMGKHKQDKPFLTFIDFVSEFDILPMMNLFALDAAAYRAKLMPKGKPVETNDCLIAGIMHANGVKKILTKNKKHFSKIPGIEIITY